MQLLLIFFKKLTTRPHITTMLLLQLLACQSNTNPQMTENSIWDDEKNIASCVQKQQEDLLALRDLCQQSHGNWQYCLYQCKCPEKEIFDSQKGCRIPVSYEMVSMPMHLFLGNNHDDPLTIENEKDAKRKDNYLFLENDFYTISLSLQDLKKNERKQIIQTWHQHPTQLLEDVILEQKKNMHSADGKTHILLQKMPSTTFLRQQSLSTLANNDLIVMNGTASQPIILPLALKKRQKAMTQKCQHRLQQWFKKRKDPFLSEAMRQDICQTIETQLTYLHTAEASIATNSLADNCRSLANSSLRRCQWLLPDIQADFSSSYDVVFYGQLPIQRSLHLYGPLQSHLTLQLTAKGQVEYGCFSLEQVIQKNNHDHGLQKKNIFFDHAWKVLQIAESMQISHE